MLVTIMKIIFLLPITLVLSIAAFVSIPFDRSGIFFRWCPWVWSKCIFWTFGIKLTVLGLEHFYRDRHYVYISNHASMFDIPAVIVALNGKVNIVFKKELVHVPIWGWALRYGPFIMIDRSNTRDAILSLERAAQSIRDGTSVLLFAEGTRTRDGKLQPFKRGAFTLAAKAGVPIVPIAINNTFRILPKGSINIKPSNISVIFDEQIPTDKINSKIDEIELMQKVHKAIEKNYINQS